MAKNTRARQQDDQPPQRLARGPVEVNRLISRLTRPVLGDRGFADADILTHWPVIVGADLATLACPLSLKYERTNQRQGAVLMVRVASSAAATLLQFKAPQVIERVNRYFGYHAVARLQVSLGVLPKTAKPQLAEDAPLSDDARKEIENTVARIGSPELQTALAQLGAAVRRRTTDSTSSDS